MKILLTGADGFLGRTCAEELSHAGHALVRTDRHGDVDLRGDLAEESFTTSLPDVDAVVHAAAVQYVSKDLPLGPRARYFERNNVRATRLLCARYAGSRTHFINVATSMMYAQDGSASYGVHSRLEGQGVYSRSKVAALAFVDVLPGRHATIVPCIIGGPGREGLFRGFVAMAVRGAVAYPGTGRHRISMVHVADVASLVRRVIETGAQGRFNAAARDALAIEQWIDVIEAELRLPRVRRVHIPLAAVHAASRATGYRILAREQLLMLAQPHVLGIDESLALGWRPRYDSRRIVAELARYLYSRGGLARIRARSV